MTRPEQELVDWFAPQMAAKLRQNRHKPNWRGEHMVALLRCLRAEVDELEEALAFYLSTSGELRDGLAHQVYAEAADVANFAAFLADKVRAREERAI